jgi:type VI secretion system secreted protein VgrG
MAVKLIQMVTRSLPESCMPVALTGSEEISRPFHYILTLRSGAALLDPDTLLHKPISLLIAGGSVHERHVSGLVAEVVQIPRHSSGVWSYQITIVPSLWFLRQTSDCRFYENKTSLSIVQSILSEFSIGNVVIRVGTPPPLRSYTVMFNETYLDFIQRLLHADGLFYFFEPAEDAAALVIADSNAAFPVIASSPVPFMIETGIVTGFSEWRRLDATTFGKIETADYNPAATPRISGEEATLLGAANAEKRSLYEWPAFGPDRAHAARHAKLHMLAVEAGARLYRGSADIPDLFAGGKFTLGSDPTSETPSSYILLSTSMTVHDEATAVSGHGSSGISVTCQAIPAVTEWRPVPRVSRPLMTGLYSATVIGPSGEDIHTDQLGRIKVQFPWDHRGETTAPGALWVRVVQPWAGAGWGGQFTPRIGMEVAISFLEGDIDRPVAVGSLYNSTNTPIYPEAQKTRSGFRSRSTKGGASDQYNEFSFDDAKGSETVLLHAQRDYLVEVEHDQKLTVDNCRIVTVKKDETVGIDGTQTVRVKQDVLYESLQSITLKVGTSSVKIDNQSITLSALQIKITGETTMETSAPMTKFAAAGIMTITGGLVKVN